MQTFADELHDRFFDEAEICLVVDSQFADRREGEYVYPSRSIAPSPALDLGDLHIYSLG